VGSYCVSNADRGTTGVSKTMMLMAIQVDVGNGLGGNQHEHDQMTDFRFLPYDVRGCYRSQLTCTCMETYILGS
jgi:hypothetical protein